MIQHLGKEYIMNRPQDSEGIFDAYFKALAEYLRDLSSQHREVVIEAAHNTRQYQYTVEKRLTLLDEGNKEEWARLLIDVSDHSLMHYRYFQKLQALLPFADKLLLYLAYGRGFVSLSKNFEQILSAAIEVQGLPTYHGDTYLLSVPPSLVSEIEVVVAECPHGTHTAQEASQLSGV
jgi:hypothetical protein